jgi:predicted acylesterase/phospholipase RssA
LALLDDPLPALQLKFKTIAKAIFDKNLLERMDPKRIIRKAGMFFRLNKSLYSGNSLESALQETFSSDAKLFSSIQASGMSYSTRVAVTAAKDVKATRCLFASYNRPTLRGGHQFEREETDEREIKVWEAARATSAAPFYLPPFVREKTEYVDGALYANCPASVALLEKDNIWADSKAPLDVLLSVGTGRQNSEVQLPAILKIGGFEKVMANFFRNLGTDPMWRELVDNTDIMAREKLLRVNPDIDESIALDEARKMDGLERSVEQQLQGPDLKGTIEKVASMLLASLFFFEPDNDYASLETSKPFPHSAYATDRHVLPGTIRCRLRAGSEELFQLMEKIDGFWYQWSDNEHSTPRPWTKILQPQALIASENDLFFRLPYTFYSTSRVCLVLAVTFKGDHPRAYPISGFPVTMENLLQRAACFSL